MAFFFLFTAQRVDEVRRGGMEGAKTNDDEGNQQQRAAAQREDLPANNLVIIRIAKNDNTHFQVRVDGYQCAIA